MGAKVLLVSKDDEVRIADVDHCAFDRAGDTGYLDGARHDARRAHSGFDPPLRVLAANELAGARAAVGAKGRFVAAFAGGKPGCNATGSVSAQLGFAAIGVEEAEEERAVGTPVKKFNAVRANACIARTKFARNRGVPAFGPGALR